jgi:anaerobic selenocysteine-containing dehydrogenase
VALGCPLLRLRKTHAPLCHNHLMKRVVHAACPHDCPDACGVLITIENGRAVKIQGDAAHPVTRGFLCAKVAKYLDRVYSPDRVLLPLKRVAPKGPSAAGTSGATAFERISWDQALDEIALRFKQIVGEHGPEAILPYSYGGTLGVLANASMDRRFFHRLGASRLARTICSETGGLALKSVLGAKLGTEPEQFAHSRLIIVWAGNVHGTNIHLWPFIEQARGKGAKLVVIDPYRTRTAALADWHIPINPGTDVALALGMMHVIIGERLYDADYVERFTTGFDELRAKVAEYNPSRVAAWTGIAAEDIVRLAREYATTRPAAIRLNYGVQRGENGGMAVRAITMLPCITGSWKEVGGGLQLSLSGGFAALRRDALERTDLDPNDGRTRTINMVELGRVLNEPLEPPIKALFVYNSNPATVAPDHGRVVRGLMRPDLFTVVHEQFLTDTCDYADIVLPATTFFEHKDLLASYGHYWLQVSQQAIEPLGECRSNVELFRALAERMGFKDACFADSVNDMIDTSLGAKHPWLEGITRERLESEGQVPPNFHANQKSEIGNQEFFLPFADGFPTASGKAELYSEALARQGLDPVATFIPPTESRHPRRNGDALSPTQARYPLEFLPRKADNWLNSTFCNLPSLQKMEADVLDITAADASERGIADGDMVCVFNDRGEIRLKARVNGRVQPGVVAAKLGWAKLSASGRSVNALTSQRLSDMGGGPTFYSTLVEVRKA